MPARAPSRGYGSAEEVFTDSDAKLERTQQLLARAEPVLENGPGWVYLVERRRLPLGAVCAALGEFRYLPPPLEDRPPQDHALVSLLRDARGEISGLQLTYVDVLGHPSATEPRRETFSLRPNGCRDGLFRAGGGAGPRCCLTEGYTEKAIAVASVGIGPVYGGGGLNVLGFGVPAEPEIVLVPDRGPPPDAWAKDGKTRLPDLHDAAYRRAVDRLILAGKTVLVAAAPDCTHAGRLPCKDADAFLTAHGSIRLRDLLERAKVAKLSDVGWRKKLADMSPEEYARGRKAFAAELGFDRVADVDAMRSCGRAGDSDKGAEKRARLIAIACEQELFRDDGDDGYAAIKRDGGAILTLKIEASGFRDWLLAEYGGRFPDNVAGRKVPGSVGESTVSDAIRTILALARQGEIREVFLRLGWRANRLYLDMATAEPRAIEITPEGWAIVADPPVNLVRSPTAKPLPVPSPAPRKHVLKELRRFFGFKLKDDRLVLLIGVLMAGLMPRGPYPILIISGEQGSGKTSRSRMVKETLDPTKASVRGRPRTEIDLAISVWRSWIGVFDNLSRLDQNLSDALCRLSEGAGLSKRKFYTDSEEVVIEAARPIILTAIPTSLSLVTRSTVRC
jgi:hypothetical protein